MSAKEITVGDAHNQSPPFRDINLYSSDRALQEAVRREGAAWADAELRAFGALTGSGEALDLGRLANENPPRLKAFDARGNRLDVVEFHPAYHEVMAISMGQGLHCAPWEYLRDGAEPKAGAQVARCAGSFMAAQMESGHCGPVTMTHASVAALVQQPEMAESWVPKILVRGYDPAFRPMGDKSSVTIGMALTERQGGTDLTAIATRAEPVNGAGPGREYAITGHKWFLSAPMCDAFVVLAQAPGGLSCFLLPRFTPAGDVNALRLQRLKDKLGNRSNASAEVAFDGAGAWLVGEEGHGLAAIADMITLTRLDGAVTSAGLMRFSVASAIHHARHRTVFGQRLVDQPLMTQVLADLALDSEAATALAFRLARAFDNHMEEAEGAFRRLMTPVIKYWVCKTAPALMAEAMECLGGNGYVEEGPLARIYRELPANALWESAGNVMCLEVLRLAERVPESVELVLAELAAGAKGDLRLEAALESLLEPLQERADFLANSRFIVEQLALVAAGVLLRASAPVAVADAFIASRLDGARHRSYGTVRAHAEARAIVDRAAPMLA